MPRTRTSSTGAETYEPRPMRRNEEGRSSKLTSKGRMLLLVACAIMTITGLSGIFYLVTQSHSMTATAEAEVSDFKQNGGTYSVEVTFEDEDDVTHHAKSLTRWHSEPNVGDKVEIRYDPWRPEGGFIMVTEENALRNNFMGYVALLVVGSVGIVITCLSLIRRRDEEEQEDTNLLSDDPNDFVSDGMSYGVSVNDGSDASSDNWENSHRMSL